MTDRSEWTDEQVNAEVAIQNGQAWIYEINGETKWGDGKGSWQPFPDDYTHDWRLAGELLEEMKFTDVTLYYQVLRDKWGIGWMDSLRSHHSLFCSTPQRAICEAWLAWKDSE